MGTEHARGTIAITGASGQVGTLLRHRLAARERDVIALERDDDWREAIARSDAVAHLAGTLQPKGSNTYEKANVGTTEAVVGPARDSKVKRIVFLSYVGADEGSPNAYLRSKARAEALLSAAGPPVAVFRCLRVYGPPDGPGPTAAAFIAKGRGRVVVPGSGRQRIAPLYIGDVVDAVLAALEPNAPTGTFDLGGPDAMTMDDFVRRLNGGSARILHVPAAVARVAARLSPALTPALMELLLQDNVLPANGREAAEAFGLSMHRFDNAWRTS